MKHFILIFSIIIPTTCFSQTDTSRCIILVKNLKRCTAKHVVVYEVSKFNDRTKEWENVKYLNRKYKPIRNRRNRRIVFYESSM